MASENVDRRRGTLFRRERELCGHQMWWILVAGITASALKKESNCLLKKEVKCISFPLTKITVFSFKRSSKSSGFSVFFYYDLNQTFTTGCKIRRHFLTWSRGVYLVYSFFFRIPGEAFSAHRVGQILHVFDHHFSQEMWFVSRTTVLLMHIISPKIHGVEISFPQN